LWKESHLSAVWQMFEDTYRAIGHQYSAAEELLAETTLWDVVLTGLPEPHIKSISGKPWNSPQQSQFANRSPN
jgi:hypothetical protein